MIVSLTCIDNTNLNGIKFVKILKNNSSYSLKLCVSVLKELNAGSTIEVEVNMNFLKYNKELLELGIVIGDDELYLDKLASFLENFDTANINKEVADYLSNEVYALQRKIKESKIHLSFNGNLVNGKIPAHTICPFKDECNPSICHHTGISHENDFSCASARGFALLKEK